MKRKIKVIMFLILFICITIIFIILTKGNEDYILKNKYSFSETMNTDINFDNIEKSNINKVLKNVSYEDSEFFGFSRYENATNLYTLNAIVKMINILEMNDNIESLKAQYSFLQSQNIENLDILNIIYYVNICEKLEIKYDINNIIHRLCNYYDKQDNLFFLNTEKDPINIKISITTLCCNTIKELLESNEFDIYSGVHKAYEDYHFKVNANNSTLYNSGGDILYCFSSLGFIDEIDLTKYLSWFNYWKGQYEMIAIDGMDSAVNYSEFYNIAKIFDKNYSSKKLYDFYMDLDILDIMVDADFFIVFNSLKNVIQDLDSSCKNKLIESVKSYIENNKLVNVKLSVQETAYGVMLSKSTGYNYNINKLQNYVIKNYEDIKNIEDKYEKIQTLYYNLIIDEIINNYSISCDINYLQKIIDNSFKELNASNQKEKDIIAIRQILEIVEDLQIHGIDLKISNKQRNKMGEITKSIIKCDNILSSYLITDIYFINNILNLNLVSDKDILTIHQKLSRDGGNLMLIDDNLQPDIITTFKFEICLEQIGDFNYLNDKKKYVASLLTNPGLYKLSSGNENSQNELAAILYANSLEKETIGGDKDDIFNKCK